MHFYASIFFKCQNFCVFWSNFPAKIIQNHKIISFKTFWKSLTRLSRLLKVLSWTRLSRLANANVHYLTVEVATGQKIQSDCILYMDLLYWNLLNVWIWKNTNSPLIDCLTWFTGFFLQFDKYSYCWQKAKLHLHALYA